MPRRYWRVAVAALLLVVAVAVWGLPNLGGPALIEVRLVVTPTVSGTSGARTVNIGSGQPGAATNLLLAVRITDRYFLPVTVGGDPEPLRVDLRARSLDGTSSTVWSIRGSAAALEPDGESPDGSAASRAYLVGVGSSTFPVGPDGGVALTDASGLPLEAGSYELRAFAFGVASGALAISIVE